MDTVMTRIVLGNTDSDMQGLLRLTELPAGLEVTVNAEGLPAEQPLRVLLLSAGEEGAVLDLGPAIATQAGNVRLTRTVPPIDLRLWDAAALAEDWPSGQVIASGWLHAPGGPIWRLAEASARFLCVPAPAISCIPSPQSP